MFQSLQGFPKTCRKASETGEQIKGTLRGQEAIVLGGTGLYRNMGSR